MTSEQRSPHPDLPIFPWPEFKWPQADVTPNDIAKIDQFRAQNNSLGASVALFILGEIIPLQDEDLEAVVVLLPKVKNLSPAMYPAMKFMIEDTLVRRGIVFGAYTAPAGVILDAEEVIRSSEPLPRDDKLGEILSHVYEKTPEEAEQIGKMLEINIDLSEEEKDEDTFIETARIDADFLARIAGKMLQETGSPIAVVDWFTDTHKASSLIKGYKDAPYLLEALEQGRQRFHRIYDAAQRLPESIT